MKVTSFDIEGIHVVARCVLHHDGKWIANMRPKKDSMYLEGATYRIEADDSSDLAALATEAVLGLDDIVGRLVSEIRVYETALKTHKAAVRGNPDAG
jgi:hypothetical protein